MIVEAIRVSPGWLDLREGADAAARARELVERLARRLPAGGAMVIHDLACGSGAMGRWLAPLLPGPQRWILHDRDPDLLALAGADVPGPAADGAAVAVETRLSDVTQLGRDDLAGATLITASALLDLLTEEELASLIHACTDAGCPVLFALSVTGRVQLTPADRLDPRFARRVRRAPAPHDAARTLARPGCRSRPLSKASAGLGPRSSSRRARGGSARPSPAWRSSGSPGGSVPRASRQPGLAEEADRYRRRRLSEAEAGRLAVTVGHADLLVLP